MGARFPWSLWLAGSACALAACNAVFGVDAGGSSTSGGIGAAGGAGGATGGAAAGAGTGGVDAMSTTSAGAGGSDPVASSRLAVGFARACVIEDDGSVRCWGDNSGGDLVSADPRAAVPVAEAVPGVTTAVQIAAGGEQECVLQVDGSVVCWGDDTDGELGSQGAPNTPQTVPGLPRAALEVEATQGCTCARLSDDTVECWGQPQTGCLGVPSTTGAISGPVAVPGVAGAIQLVVGAYGDASCARLGSGQVILLEPDRGAGADPRRHRRDCGRGRERLRVRPPRDGHRGLVGGELERARLVARRALPDGREHDGDHRRRLVLRPGGLRRGRVRRPRRGRDASVARAHRGPARRRGAGDRGRLRRHLRREPPVPPARRIAASGVLLGATISAARSVPEHPRISPGRPPCPGSAPRPR